MSRRRALLALGAGTTAALAGTAPFGQRAGATPPPPPGGGPNGDPTPTATDFLAVAADEPPPEPPGAPFEQLTVGSNAFVPLDSTTGWQYSLPGGLSPRSLSFPFFAAPLQLPAGALVKRIDFGIKPGGTACTCWLERYRAYVPSYETVAFATTPAAATLLTFSLLLNETIDNRNFNYRLEVGLNSVSSVFYGARVTFLPPRSGLVSLPAAVRALDTRDAGGSAMKTGDTRTLDLSRWVPAGSRSALLNLTVVRTEGAGFLAAYPAGTDYPGTSSINWFAAGQITANLVLAGLDERSAVTLRCGAGATDVVVDLLGYFP